MIVLANVASSGELAYPYPNTVAGGFPEVVDAISAAIRKGSAVNPATAQATESTRWQSVASRSGSVNSSVEKASE